MYVGIVGDAVLEMAALPDASIDVVLTDPPYSSGARREAGATVRTKVMTRSADAADWFGSDSLGSNGFAFLMRSCAVQWHRLLVDGGHALVFIDWRMAPQMSAAIESADLRPVNLIVWDKGRMGMGTHFRHQHELVLHFCKGQGRTARRRDVPNVLQCPPVAREAQRHPTQKPVDLLRRLLSVVCPPGGVVLDPFAGSGAVGLAAEVLDMHPTLIERERRYVEAWARADDRQPGLFDADGAV